MKRKLISTAVSLLLCLGVVGSGFAAWVISRTTEGTTNGNFTIETVKETKVDFKSVEVADGSSSTIVFGAPTTTAQAEWQTQNPNQAIWFDYETSTPTENLSVQVDIVIQNVDEWLSGYDYALTFAVTGKDDADVTAYDAAISGGYLSAPTFTLAANQGTISNNAITLDASKKTESNEIVLNLTVTFAWGEVFEGENPYFYFNGMENSETNASAAKTAIEAFDDLNGINFKLVVTGTATKTVTP